ncbi:hypothetical protein B0H14DRAFT_2880712 [Mycena olivaceomarginata]|nr:hypothetical protein B0H14DRAFT_2880712 [Mycena olivaceomarginata]
MSNLLGVISWLANPQDIHHSVFSSSAYFARPIRCAFHVPFDSRTDVGVDWWYSITSCIGWPRNRAFRGSSFLAQKALPGCHITHARAPSLVRHWHHPRQVGAAQRLSIYVLLRSVGDGREEQGTSQVYLRGAASSLCAILVSIIFSQTGKEGKERDDNAQPRAVLGARSGDQCAQGRVRPQRGDVIAQHREHLPPARGMLSCSAASTSVGSLHPVVPLHATVFSALRAGEAERADPALDPELGGIEDSASERELEVRGTEAAAECGGNGVKGCEAQVRCRCGARCAGRGRESDGRREGDV